MSEMLFNAIEAVCVLLAVAVVMLWCLELGS
jgi:hypothetical protein